MRQADLIDAITHTQNAKNAAAAAQYDAIHTFARAHADTHIAAGITTWEEVERSIAVQIGYACRVSPSEGRNRLHTARDLHTGHTHLRQLFAAGKVSEYQVTTICRATRHLTPPERAHVDQQLADRHVETLGIGRTRDLARKPAAEVAPEKFQARARAARSGRHVSVRPAADGMAYLSALPPAEQTIACLGSLAKAAHRAAVDPTPVTRGRGTIMADTLVERLTGHTTADTVAVEVQILVPVDALLDPDSPLPAEIPGHGPIPLERILYHHGKASIRRLLTKDGIVIGGDSTQRTFTGTLATFIRARDGGRCREAYCDAPIRHFDHILRHTDGGTTTSVNSRGVCETHNYVREHPGWRVKRFTASIVTTTPTGHAYTSDDGIGTTARKPRTPPKSDHRN